MFVLALDALLVLVQRASPRCSVVRTGRSCAGQEGQGQ